MAGFHRNVKVFFVIQGLLEVFGCQGVQIRSGVAHNVDGFARNIKELGIPGANLSHNLGSVLSIGVVLIFDKQLLDSAAKEKKFFMAVANKRVFE
jgi:hypothetical protein